LRLTDIATLTSTNGGQRKKLATFVDHMLHSLGHLSNALTLTYFRHADRPHFLHG
jgi:hypothetical protein